MWKHLTKTLNDKTYWPEEMFSCNITALTNDKKVKEQKQRIGEDGRSSEILPRLTKRVMPSQEPEEATALGLQDNNFTSWPTSHLQDINSLYVSPIQNAFHHLQMRDNNLRAVDVSCLSRL